MLTDQEIITVLQKDAIPAITDPQFVPASEAIIDDTAEIIGINIGKDSRAYSLNLLNNHEIVNDTVGGKKIAVTW